MVLGIELMAHTCYLHAFKGSDKILVFILKLYILGNKWYCLCGTRALTASCTWNISGHPIFKYNSSITTQLSLCVFPERYSIYHLEDVLKCWYSRGWKTSRGLDPHRIHSPDSDFTVPNGECKGNWVFLFYVKPKFTAGSYKADLNGSSLLVITHVLSATCHRLACPLNCAFLGVKSQISI